MFASRTNWPLEPNRFARALEAHRHSGKPLLDLTASNPTACGFAYPEAEILAALADPRALRYRPDPKGLRETREAVAEYYRERAGFFPSAERVDPERVLLAASTSEGYSYIFRLLCEPGDEVLVPAPSYPLFEFLADLADVRLVPYPLLYDHGWQMDFASLRAALTSRSRAVLVVHPNNPTGSFVKARETAALAEICASREMAMVADEVFLDYGDAESVATTFAFGSAALTFTLSGLSKICALPQMKLAWIVTSGPAHSVQAAMERLEIIADTFLSPSTPVQLATAKFLALRGSLASQLRARIAANLAFLDSTLPARGAICRLRREGGWYAVLRMAATPGAALEDDEEFAVALLDRCSVLVHPGHLFNFPGDGFLVVSLIVPEDEFSEGIRRLIAFRGTQPCVR